MIKNKGIMELMKKIIELIIMRQYLFTKLVFCTYVCMHHEVHFTPVVKQFIY